jgi:hypothetical protein
MEWSQTPIMTKEKKKEQGITSDTSI